MERSVELRDPQDAYEPTTFVFGAQVLSPTKECIDKLLRPLSNGAAPEWILDTVSGLPRYWDELIKTIPEVAGTSPGPVSLADLESWLRIGLPDGEQVAQLPNIVLTPLVIISQLTQYWRYLERRHRHADKADIDLQVALVARHSHGLHKAKVETLGFCIGLLSSFAVASASNKQEFEQYGAVAVRLAMLTGALADAQEGRTRGIGQGRSVAYATAWRGAKQGEDMMRIVEGLAPEAYVSVLYDTDRATVTSSKRKAPLLVKQLRAADVTAVEVGLRARVHNPIRISPATRKPW